MDWNNDGRVDGYGYALYKSVIDTDSNSSSGKNSQNHNSSTKGIGAIGWMAIISIIYFILKVLGLN
jgi:hypothetical protein